MVIARPLSTLFLAAALSLHPLSAQEHVVSPAELQTALSASAQSAAQNRELVDSRLRSPQAQRALRSAKMDPAKLRAATAALTPDELAQLAARIRTADEEFSAGRISDRDLIIILVGLAALILVIVAVR